MTNGSATSIAFRKSRLIRLPERKVAEVAVAVAAAVAAGVATADVAAADITCEPAAAVAPPPDLDEDTTPVVAAPVFATAAAFTLDVSGPPGRIILLNDAV